MRVAPLTKKYQTLTHAQAAWHWACLVQNVSVFLRVLQVTSPVHSSRVTLYTLQHAYMLFPGAHPTQKEISTNTGLHLVPLTSTHSAL